MGDVVRAAERGTDEHYLTVGMLRDFLARQPASFRVQIHGVEGAPNGVSLSSAAANGLGVYLRAARPLAATALLDEAREHAAALDAYIEQLEERVGEACKTIHSNPLPEAV